MINKVFNEDCLIGMQRISDSSVDVVVTDVPYGMEFLLYYCHLVI